MYYTTRQPACLLLSVLISAHLPRPISFPWCFASFLLVFLSGLIGNPLASLLLCPTTFLSVLALSWIPGLLIAPQDNMSKGHYHDMSAGTQNQGNKLGDRSCIRQSRLYREYESGNSVKDLLGTSNLKWNPNKKEGEPVMN